MNATKPSSVAGSAARSLLLSAALVFASAAQATTNPVPIAGKIVLDAGNTIAFTAPEAAVDSNGNIHIASAGSEPGQLDACKDHDCNIYYTLVSPSGAVLIRASRLNVSDAGVHGHPHIAVTSKNQAVVTWGGANEILRYALVDPSKQGSLNGNALQPAAIAVAETVVGNDAGEKHAMVLDKKNIAYVVRHHGTDGNGSLDFLKFDPATGEILHPQAAIPGTTDRELAFPSMALDSKGNLHVLYSAIDLDSDAPAGYLMLDANGNKLIGTTQLFNSVPNQHPHVQKQHLFVSVGPNDILSIVYGDKRNTPDAVNWCNVCASGGTSVFVRLDPSKVSHNGNPANIAALRVGREIEVPGFWYGRAFFGGDNLIHLVAGLGKTGSLAHIAFSPSAGGIALQPKIHTGSTLNGADFGPKFVAGAKNMVVWAESVPDGSTLRLVMAPVKSLY